MFLGCSFIKKFQYNRVEKFSQCSPNLKSLFIEVTNTETPQLIGVIYRSPSGNVTGFCTKFEILLSKLPDNNVHIRGRSHIT